MPLNTIREAIVAIINFVPGFGGAKAALRDSIQRQKDMTGNGNPGSEGKPVDYIGVVRDKEKAGDYAKMRRTHDLGHGQVSSTLAFPKSFDAEVAAAKSRMSRGATLDQVAPMPSASETIDKDPDGLGARVYERMMALRQALSGGTPGDYANSYDFSHVTVTPPTTGAGGSKSAVEGAWSADKVRRIAHLASAPNKLDPIFQREAAKWGIDWRLGKTIAATESGFDPWAVGKPTRHGRAYGVMQNLEHPEDLGNAEQSIIRGMALLAQKIRAHGGSVPGGVKGYNGAGHEADIYEDGIMRASGLAGLPGIAGAPQPAMQGDAAMHHKVAGGVTVTLVDQSGNQLAKTQAPLKSVGKPTPAGVLPAQ